jgi:ribosomal protein S15P/S13E
MEVHKQDKHSKHRYEIVLSKIKRLSDYYIREGVISERPSV